MITDWIGRHEVLLPINHKNYNFREKKNSQVIKERENLHLMWLWNRQQQNGFAGKSDERKKESSVSQKRNHAGKHSIAQNFAEFGWNSERLSRQFFGQDSRFLGWVNRQLTSSCKRQSQSQWRFFVSLAFWDGDFLNLSCWCFLITLNCLF